MFWLSSLWMGKYYANQNGWKRSSFQSFLRSLCIVFHFAYGLIGLPFVPTAVLILSTFAAVLTIGQLGSRVKARANHRPIACTGTMIAIGGVARSMSTATIPHGLSRAALDMGTRLIWQLVGHCPSHRHLNGFAIASSSPLGLLCGAELFHAAA